MSYILALKWESIICSKLLFDLHEASARMNERFEVIWDVKLSKKCNEQGRRLHQDISAT